MIKNTLIALVATAALAGVAAPAFAASSLSGNDNQNYDFDRALTELQSRGINATSVEGWTDDVVRAYIVGPDGHQTMAFFSSDTLTPVAR